MSLRGPLVEVGELRDVGTKYGERSLAEVTFRPERGTGEPVTVTLWEKWTHAAEHVEPGTDILVTDAKESEYRGETMYLTGSELFIVVEPNFLVDVTSVRSWVQYLRMYCLNKLLGIPLNHPVVRGTVVHDVFGDLLRDRDLDSSTDERIDERGLELGLLGREVDEVADEVRRNAAAIERRLSQGVLTDEDERRSGYTLIPPTFGIKGRADALRQGSPVEFKTGKNLNRDPRFQDKIQAASYALILEERGFPVDMGTPPYMKNTTLDRTEESGDLSPAKDFSIGRGLLEFVVRTRNEIAAMEHDVSVPTGHGMNSKCEYCFEKGTCMIASGRLGQESKAGAVGKPVPEDECDHFDRFYRAVEEERRSVHKEYRKLWDQSTEERTDDDRAFIGLEPIDRTERPDGTWEPRAKQTDDAASKLRAGDVALASDGHPVKGHAELARIVGLGDEVVVTTDEPVPLRRLDVYPSELTADRLLTALHGAVLKGLPDCKDVLFDRRGPDFSDHSAGRTFIDNNDAQDNAVCLAVDADDLTLIHGSSGTGKTHTIARTIRALVEGGNRVLLSAFTNRAANNVLEVLRDQGSESIVHVGIESGVREGTQGVRFSRSGDPNALAAALRNVPVVVVTTASCGSRVMHEQSFGVALVDEASQITEPGTLAAVNLVNRFAPVGDHKQLPPVVRAENDLQTSLLQRLIETYPDASVMLSRQYRMSQRIRAFASREFYDGALRPATGAVAAQHLRNLGVDIVDLPAEFADQVTFVDPDDRRVDNTNPTETDHVAEVVAAYEAAGVDADDIGVIAPLRAQVAEISRRTDATVSTVDRFQGSSREVIIVSFVAIGELDGPLFEDHRRINVALTRVKKTLCPVGDTDALESDPFYDRMLAWAWR